MTARYLAPAARHLPLALILACAILVLPGCSEPSAPQSADAPENPDGAVESPAAPRQDAQPAGEAVLAQEPGPAPRAEPPAQEPGSENAEPDPSRAQAAEAVRRADQQRRARAKRLFGKVIEPLDEAAEAYQRHDDLDDWSLFGRDKGDNLEAINELLDGVIESLGVSEVADTRSRLRTLEAGIHDLEAAVVRDREARLGAPTKDELNRVQRVYKTSREEYDARIEEALLGIEAKKRAIDELHVEFVEQLRGLGLEIDGEGARSLLATVTGDDFVQMCVVLDNVRGLTLQLQELTEESGESLEAARRYYGAYLMLVRMMDRLQKEFIARASEEMLPKLDVLAEKAKDLIAEARKNLKRGGDRAILEQNIASNELTIQATGLYAEYLRAQIAEIRARNEALQVTLRDAENTFDTVTLSRQVAAILSEGQRNFAALLRLELPPLRGFENAELQAEFARLTEQIHGLQ